MYFNDDDKVNQSSRERRRQPKQNRAVNEGSVEREVDDNRPTLEENGIPAYRKKKQPTKRRSRNVDSGDELDTTDKRKVRKPKSPSQRLPRSVSEEVLALEGRFYPEETQMDNRQRRGKKQRERIEADPGISIEKPSAGRKLSQTNRRRKKPKSALVPSGDDENYQGDLDGEISEIFHVDQEDLVDGANENSNKQNTAVLAQPSIPSQPLDFMFIEKKDGQGFLREHRSYIVKGNQNDTEYATDLLDANKDNTTLDFMLKVHLTFRKISTSIHGLLAGLAIAQCVFVYVLANISNRNLLENYYKLAQPFQSIYYMFFAICCLSILDRYINVNVSWSQLVFRLFTKPSRLLATLSYILGLMLSVSIASMDDRISLQKELPHIWTSSERLRTWKIINLLRVIGAVLGWFAVAIAPDDDYTEKTIREAIKVEVESQMKFEMKHLPSPRSNGCWNGTHNA